MIYEYDTFQSSTGHIWCKAHDTQIQQKIICDLQQKISKLLEAEGKNRTVFKALTQTIDERTNKPKLKRSKTGRPVKKSFKVKDLINKKTPILANSGDNGYFKQPEQSPKSVYAGIISKFSEVVNTPNTKNLSPVQIRIFNVAKKSVYTRFADIIVEQVWTEKEGSQYVSKNCFEQGKWFFELIDSLHIKTENVEFEKNKVANSELEQHQIVEQVI